MGDRTGMHDAAPTELLDAHGRPRRNRRELVTEGAVAAAFTAASFVAYRLLDGADANPLLCLWLAIICALTARVEFDVGEGCTRPIQVVLASMFVVLPLGAVPVVVATGQVLSQSVDVARRRIAPRRLLMAIADSWFCLGPTVVIAATGLPTGWPAGIAIVAGAVIAQFLLDFVISGVRVRVGAGQAVRPLLRAFAWVWLVDLLLVPVGVFAAMIARDEPLAVAGVLPLVVLLAVFARERTGRIENALALRRIAQEGQDRLQSIVQNASDLIAIVRADGTMNTVTGAVEDVFGPGWETVQGAPLTHYVHPDDVTGVQAFLAGVADKPIGDSQESEWRLRYADGSWRHVSAVATNLLADPRVRGLVVTARDVDARKAFEEQLRHRAFHDPLTGLANRALFYDRIEHALTREPRTDGHVAVLYLDLDDFKPVNDRLGHAAGDRVLVAAAERLRTCMRSADTVARLGGDEFGVLIEAVSGPNEPVKAAERILAAFSEPFAIDEETLHLPLSVGITLSETADGAEDLLRHADLALYAAKRAGKRCIEVYEPGLERGSSSDGELRATWLYTTDEQREEVLSVLARDDAMAIAVQPIVDLRTGRVAGYEALSRFNDVHKRPPNVWFAQAHRCGLGYELEAKALALALAVPGRPDGTYLTVNLSPSALTSDAVAAVLPERLDDLVIEITENEVLADDPKIAAALRDVRRRGARLAVDDTGSGYAGLTQVMRLAPDVIKLDRSLVAGVANDPVKAALIESFVRYARDIDASVCVEGIEDLDDLARLADLDVAYGQGYGLGRPGPPWPDAVEEAASTCRASFTASLAEDAPTGTGNTQDHGLELLLARLSLATDAHAIEALAGPIARELGADAVRLVPADAESAGAQLDAATAPRLRQTLAGDPATDQGTSQDILSLGFRSRLQVPIRSRATTLAILEAYSASERPWSRFETRRARMIASGIAAALALINRDAEEVARPRSSAASVPST
jgi:diguanylate cyclase (GGDEF)-like protein/PAS domain S-box-containing protein